MKILKRLLCLAVVFVLAASVCACSKDSNNITGQSSAKQGETTASDGLIYYDKYGNAFSSLCELKYYDADNHVYTYDDSASDAVFICEDSTKLPAEKCFVDKNGTFIYDAKGAIVMGDDYVSAADKNGNVYYPAATVRWANDGSIVNFFGLGEDIN